MSNSKINLIILPIATFLMILAAYLIYHTVIFFTDIMLNSSIYLMYILDIIAVLYFVYRMHREWTKRIIHKPTDIILYSTYGSITDCDIKAFTERFGEPPEWGVEIFDGRAVNVAKHTRMDKQGGGYNIPAVDPIDFL